MMRSLGTFLSAIVIALNFTACIGIPVSGQTVQKIIATGWDSDGAPIAIAATAHLGRRAYPMGPEGPQVVWRRTFQGLSVLKNGAVVEVDLKIPKAAYYWGSAVALPSGDGFLVLLETKPGDLATEEWRCAIVRMDGSSKPCIWPDRELPPPYAFYLPGDGHTVRVRRQLDRSHYWFESWDVSSGMVSPIEQVFLTFPLRNPTDPKPLLVPCDMRRSRLSPQQDSYAVACTLLVNGTLGQRGLWVISESAEPQLALPIAKSQTSPSPYEEPDWVTKALYASEDHYGLAWSSTGEEIYFCPDTQRGEGVLVSRAGVVKRQGLPCLSYVTWSPIADKIVGVLKHEVHVIDLSDPPRED